jgi:lipoate-protein ligase A
MNNVSTDNRWYNDTNNETLIQAIENGTVRLYNNNIECLETKSSGNAVIDNLGAALHHGTAITSGRVTTSTAAPSGGSNGDVWFRY